MQLSHPKYRPDIDGLRAIAVLAVLIFHAFPGKFHGGFIGVDIFFVISGFLITTIIVQNLENNNFSFSNFYSRRIKRIFPSLILILACSFIAGWFLLLAPEFMQLGKHIVSGATFSNNIVLWKESGYFDGNSNGKILLHLWSLGVEEQFYILWPLILWFGHRNNINKTTITIIIGIISFSLNITFLKNDSVFDFYSLNTRAWELLIGAITAQAMLSKRKNEIKEKLSEALTKISFSKTNGISTDKKDKLLSNTSATIGIVFITIGLIRISSETAFPGKFALLPTIGASLIILAGQTSRINNSVLSKNVLVQIGKISFPLYLWHWPIFSFLNILESNSPNIQQKILAIIASFILAICTTYFIEKPIRADGASKLKITILLTLMAALASIGLYVYKNNGLESRDNISQFKEPYSQLVGALWKYENNQDCTETYKFDYAKDLRWWFCYTNKKTNPEIMLIGNSRINDLVPGLLNNKLLSNKTILSIGNSLPDQYLPWQKNMPGAPDDFLPRQREIIDSILTKSKPETAIVLMPSNVTKELIERLKFIQEEARELIVISDPIVLKGTLENRTPEQCLGRPFKQKLDCSIPIDRINESKIAFKTAQTLLTQAGIHAAYFDQNDYLCKNGKCSFIINNMPLFRDEGHRSEYASNIIVNNMYKWAKANNLLMAKTK